MVRTAAALILLLLTAEVRSETVDVKYRGPVDLETFECRDTPRSSFIQRVCYDKPQSYMIINLKGTYYHYCDIRRADGCAIDGTVLQSEYQRLRLGWPI